MNNEDYNKDDFKREFKAFVAVIAWLIVAAVVCSIFGSCRSQFVDITDDMFIHDTTFINKVQIDTVIQHDSIWHYECLKGDSVIVKDYIYKYIYKPKIEYRDSIVYRDREQVYVQTKTVEAKQTLWNRIMTWLGKATFVLLLLAGVVFAMYFIFRRK